MPGANLPGMGGIYNSRNLQTYHYAGNNPIKYTDPTGEFVVLAIGVLFWGGALVGLGYATKDTIDYYLTGKQTKTNVLEAYGKGWIVGLKLGASYLTGVYFESKTVALIAYKAFETLESIISGYTDMQKDQSLVDKDKTIANLMTIIEEQKQAEISRMVEDGATPQEIDEFSKAYDQRVQNQLNGIEE
jgi:hypothetical protein